MIWIDYYRVYLGMKLHFENSSYSYLKYGAKNVSEFSVKKHYLLLKSIESHRESKSDFEKRLIALGKTQIPFIASLYTQSANEALTEYLDELAGWEYYLNRDLEYLCYEGGGKGLSFRDMFFSDNELRLPFVISMLERGRINYHTVSVLSKLIPFCGKISPMLFDVQRLQKYSELHDFDMKKVAKIVKPHMENMNNE